MGGGDRAASETDTAPAPSETDSQPAASLGRHDAMIIARGDIEDVAALVQTRPWQRDQIFRTLQTQRGNGFTQQVIATIAPTQGSAKTEDDDAAPDGRPVSSQFKRDPVLDDVQHGRSTLTVGDKGPAVRKVQQALYDLGYQPISVTGTYDEYTAARVRDLQRQAKIARVDGVLDGVTFQTIESGFKSLQVYARAAQHEAPGMHDTPKRQDPTHPATALMRETHELAADEKAEAGEVISPALAMAGQAPAAFQPTIPAGDYGKRVETLLRSTIDEHYKGAKAKASKHEHGSKLFSMDRITDVGNAARAQVNTVFGSWATGGVLTANFNIKDRFEADRAEQSKEKPKARHEDAVHRARYFTTTVGAFETIDAEHSADRRRPAEKQILDQVLDRVATTDEEKLLLITATWSASTDGEGIIKIQRFNTGSDDGDRDVLWNKFGTLIHEYCHSLTHPQWRKFRDAKVRTDPQGADTLTEGVTELLTRIVLSSITVDKQLRKQVEGNLYQDDGDAPDLDRDAYESELVRAKALVGVVGIHNLYAAYFLGQTQLIG